MREWTDVAFIVRTGYFREIDIWLTVLVPEYGLFTCFAFGGAKSRHRFCGCLESLNTIRGHFSFRREAFCTLQEAVLVAGPRKLRSDWRRMGLAANCLRFIQACGVERETAGAVFALLENMRETLDNRPDLPDLFPLFFRLLVAEVLGYAPNFVSCGACGKPFAATPVFFQVDEGLLFCPDCQKKSQADRRFRYPLFPRERALLKQVVTTLPSAWTDGGLSAEEKRHCLQAVDGFVHYHLGISWEKGTFRKL